VHNIDGLELCFLFYFAKAYMEQYSSKKNIALVAGGYSGEAVISFESAKTIEQHIPKEKYNVYKILLSKSGWIHTGHNGNVYHVNREDFTLTIGGEKVGFDCAFIGIHGTPGEDGKLQGYFDMMQIPYTGCGSISSALTFNKIYCNRVVSTYDVVNVAKSIQMFAERPLTPDQILKQITLPMFVKPVEGGSSLGTSKVKEPAQLQAALDAAYACDTQIMAEEFVGGREFSIGIYEREGEVVALPVTEIISETEFFDYKAKYEGASKEVTPADITGDVHYRISDTAKRIYRILNCRGVVRADFILETATDKLFFLEINTMPGQSAESIVPQQVRAAGGNLTEFYDGLLQEAMRK
jgi:D-alanine-D-alanine ligase